MIRPMLIIVLPVIMLVPICLADSHTDDATGFTIKFPDNWAVDEADAVIANAPDHLASMLVIAMKDTKDAAEALQRLDRDDVMGKKINGLPAKLFTGTASIANIKMPFVAAVIQDKDPAFVVFAFPANNAHLKRMITSIETIRGPASGK